MDATERIKKLRQTIDLLAGEFAQIPGTDYVICVVSRTEDGRDAASAVESNLHQHDSNGRCKAPSIGQLVDLLVEAQHGNDSSMYNVETIRRPERAHRC